MAEEKKLGPNVTYNPEEGEGAPSVVMGGLTLVPGKAVNLVDFYAGDEAKAQAALKKLAGNPVFKVDGGPDHKALRERQEKVEENTRKSAEEAREREEVDKAKAEKAKAADDERGSRVPRR
jgi:hypothetical protein